jgi:hypothetical protein
MAAPTRGGMLRWLLRRQRMRQTPTLDIQPARDPLATIAVSAAPVVLEGRYRVLMRALWELRHSRRSRWGVGLGSAAFMLLLAFLAVRHFATTSWPLSRGEPGSSWQGCCFSLPRRSRRSGGHGCSPTASGPLRLRL